jgi:threonine/homoserine/homoserine lactone efflux protein
MGYVMPLVLGALTATLGIVPPGMINMTAARLGMDEGRQRALIFSLGATLILVVQVLIAVIFARFLDRNPDVVLILREIGLFIFIGLTIFFFRKGKSAPPTDAPAKLKSRRSRLFMGMLLSALNFFTIPFYVLVSISLASYKVFSFDLPFIYTFATGVAIGTYFGFYCYIMFFKKMESKTEFILSNMNYIIGAVTGLVSLLTMWNIIRHYWV